MPTNISGIFIGLIQLGNARIRLQATVTADERELMNGATIPAELAIINWKPVAIVRLLS
jgi:hypothetical protein